ncbi:hypothetical protein B6U99_03280 [Candidatus Geothermarchaeota archaeon ex4572_27]|nr:MAG: hypothetical protein B6U99_03280 [Candidatus Geothermarchaeota archaeon ex4572_27]
MSKEIRLTADELMLMSVFQTFTGIRPMNCVLEGDNIFFIVDSEDIPKLVAEFRHLPSVSRALRSKSAEAAILRECTRELSRALKKNVYIVKYSSDPKEFLRNFFMLRPDETVEIVNRSGGRRYAIVRVQPKRKGVVIGRGGFRAKVARELAKQYFELETVLIR